MGMTVVLTVFGMAMIFLLINFLELCQRGHLLAFKFDLFNNIGWMRVTDTLNLNRRALALC